MQKEDSTYWSPWGQSWAAQPFLKLPQNIPKALATLGFGHAEILVIMGVFLEIRQGTSLSTVSHQVLAQYANCNPRTARRAIQKMVEFGAKVMKKGTHSFSPNTYDVSGFISTLELVP
jgi:hypothetical protein